MEHSVLGETGVRMTSSFWFTEEVTQDMQVKLRLENIQYDTQSEFQRVQVVTTAPMGKTLVLDGKTQSAQVDEFVYHECLVHPSMLTHGNPKSVYIGGGGEMATAREVLRHKSVEKCIMVDLDKVVVDVSLDRLPEWGDGCMDDPRLEVHYTDAHAWLKEYDGKFDVIIMDIADPIEAGPGYVLYTQEFYQYALEKLNPGGVLVTQSGPGALSTYTECFTVIHSTLRSTFPNVVPYTVDIPSFGGVWAFNMAFKEKSDVPIQRRSPESVDEAVSDKLSSSLRFLDGVSWQGIFGTPKWLREAIKKETRIMTIDNPHFMH